MISGGLRSGFFNVSARPGQWLPIGHEKPGDRNLDQEDEDVSRAGFLEMLFLLDAVFFLFEFHAVAKQSSHINICVSTASCDLSPTMLRSQVHLLRQ